MASSVAFDAVGAGYFGSGATATSANFNHIVATAGADVFVFVVSDRSSTIGAKWGGSGGTSMTSIGTINNNNSGTQADGCLTLFHIANVAKGTTVVNITSSTASWMCAQSVSYTGVGSFSPATTAFGTGTTSVSQASYALPTGCMALQAFGFGCGTGTPGFVSAGFTSPTGGTSRTPTPIKSNFSANIFSSLSVSDTSTGSTTFGATVPSGAFTSSMTFMLSPGANITTGTPDVQATGTVLYDTDATGYGLATSGSTGTTVTWSHPLGTFASGVVVTVLGDYSSGGGSPPPGGNCPSYAAYTRTLTFNGTAMTLLAALDFSPPGGIGPTGTDGWLEMWGITGSPVTAAANTSATLVLNERFTGAPSTFLPELSCWSGSYNGVTAFGTPSTIDGNNVGTFGPSSVTSPITHMVVGCFGSDLLSSPSGTLRYNLEVLGYGNWSMLVQDSAGNPSGLSMTASGFAGYSAAIVTDLIPGTLVSPTTANVVISGGTSGVVATANVSVTPTAATTVTVTGGTPGVTNLFDALPPTATVTVTPSTPDVVFTTNYAASPASTDIALSGGTSVVLGADYTATPAPATVTFTGGTSTVTGISIFFTPTTATVVITGRAPTVTNGGVVNDITFFTVTANYYDIQSPSYVSTSNAAEFIGISGGNVTFHARLPGGFTILVANLDLGSGNSGSAMIALPPITGTVVSTPALNGGVVWELCAQNSNNSPGIQLLANTSIISSYLAAQGIEEGQLIYDVSFSDVTFAGENQIIENFAFVAPTTNSTLCLTAPGTFTSLPYRGDA